MKRYTLPFARVFEHKPEHPDRTAYRNAAGGPMQFDLEFQVWPNRPAMLKTIELQERRAPSKRDWRDWSKSRFALKEADQLVGSKP